MRPSFSQLVYTLDNFLTPLASYLDMSDINVPLKTTVTDTVIEPEPAREDEDEEKEEEEEKKKEGKEEDQEEEES